MDFDIGYLLALFYVLLSFIQINIALLARSYFRGDIAVLLTSVLYVLGLVYLVVGAVVVGLSTAEPTIKFFEVLGYITIAFAVFYGVWALLELRAGAVMPARELVVTGPYKITRHPFFSAIVILCFGLSMVLSSVMLIAYGALSAFFLLHLGLAEERELSRKFKKRFADYKKRTGAIFPKLVKPSA